jgi:hypothetical protein
LGGETVHGANIAQAKLNLRTTASEHGLSAWVRRHPKEAVAGTGMLGFVLGSSPRLMGLLRQGAMLLLKLKLF